MITGNPVNNPNIETMGDLDRDGVVDFAYSYQNDKKVYIIYGHASLGGSLSYAIATLNTNPFFGFIITSAAGTVWFSSILLGNFDRNGDGNPDIMVSDPRVAYTASG
jgi:hypothetical protein